MSRINVRRWRRLSLWGACTALVSAAALAACDERTETMNQAPATGQIAAPVASALNTALRAALGDDHARRVTTYTDTPKGLFRDGRLHLAPGTAQQIRIYGDLDAAELGAVVRALSSALAADRGPEHAPVHLTVCRAEVFVVGEDGSRARGKEDCLWEGVLPQAAPSAVVTPGVTLPSR